MTNLINSLNEFLVKMLSLDESSDEQITLTRQTFSFRDGTEGFYFLNYKEHHALLISLKYSEERATARILRPLYAALKDLCTDIFTESQKTYLVPLPQSRLRVLRRGFNQTRRLLSEMMRLDRAKRFHFEVGNLIKVRETKKQALLSRSERLLAQKGAFKVRMPERLKDKTIFLFDDIVTTGASLAEAREVLLDAGAKTVICVALAH